MNDTLLARSGPSDAAASSLIVRSAPATRSSPVPSRRMLAIAIRVPSASIPVNAARTGWTSGSTRTASICACVTDSKPSTPSTNLISEAGAMTGSAGARSSCTPGSLTTSLRRASIWERPVGVSASPRNRSVTALISPWSPKSSLVSSIASATALPSGSVSAVSGDGAWDKASNLAALCEPCHIRAHGNKPRQVSYLRPAATPAEHPQQPPQRPHVRYERRRGQLVRRWTKAERAAWAIEREARSQRAGEQWLAHQRQMGCDPCPPPARTPTRGDLVAESAKSAVLNALIFGVVIAAGGAFVQLVLLG